MTTMTILHWTLLLSTNFVTMIQCKYPLHYWELKPYIYMENGVAKGILVDYFKEMKQLHQACPQPSVDTIKSIDSIFTIVHRSESFKEFIYHHENYTKLASKNESAIWFPVISRHFEDLGGHPVVVLSDDALVIIVKENTLDYLSKFYKTFRRLKDVALSLTLIVVLFSVVLRVSDFNNNPAYCSTFVRSFGTAFWLTWGSVTAVGYGDITSKTVLARIVAVLLMLFGMIVAATLNALSYDVFKSNDFSYNEKFAILNGSFEERAFREAGKKQILGFNSYEEVLESVRTEKAQKAVLPRQVAAYMQYEWNKGSSREKSLAVAKIMEGFDIPIQGLATGNEVFHYSRKCDIHLRLNAITYAKNKYRKLIQVYKVSSEKSKQFLLERRHIHYMYFIIAALIILGICFDIGQWIRRKTRNTQKAVEAEITHHQQEQQHTIEMDKEEIISLQIEIRLINTRLQELLDNYNINETMDNINENGILPNGIENKGFLTHSPMQNTRISNDFYHTPQKHTRRDLKRVMSVQNRGGVSPTIIRVRRSATSVGAYAHNQIRNSSKRNGKMNNFPKNMGKQAYNNRKKETQRVRNWTPSDRAVLKRGKSVIYMPNENRPMQKPNLRRGESFPARIYKSTEEYNFQQSVPKRIYMNHEIKQRPSLDDIQLHYCTEENSQIGHISPDILKDKLTINAGEPNSHRKITEC